MSEISDLFAKDPLHLTKEDLASIVEKYRANRQAWINAGTSAKPKAVKAAAGPKLDLGDLDL